MFIHGEGPVKESWTTSCRVARHQRHLFWISNHRENRVGYSGRHTGQSSADRVARFIYQNTGIVVESDVASIFSLLLLVRSDYYGVSDVSSLDLVRNA